MPQVAAKEVAFAALAAALTTALASAPTVLVDRNRRAEVQAEEMPRVVLGDGGHEVMEDFGFQLNLYRCQGTLEGYVTGATAALAISAMHDLHARCVAVLGTVLTPAGMSEGFFCREVSTEIDDFEASESATPCAMFRMTFRFDLPVPFNGPFVTVP